MIKIIYEDFKEQIETYDFADEKGAIRFLNSLGYEKFRGKWYDSEWLKDNHYNIHRSTPEEIKIKKTEDGYVVTIKSDVWVPPTEAELKHAEEVLASFTQDFDKKQFEDSDDDSYDEEEYDEEYLQECADDEAFDKAMSYYNQGYDIDEAVQTACNEVDNGYADYYTEDDPMYWISPNKNTVYKMVQDRINKKEK